MAFQFQHLPTTGQLDDTANFEQWQAQLAAGLAPFIEPETITEAMLVKAVQEKLKPGAWTELTLSAKLEAFPGFQTIRARLEQGGANVRLRGVAKVKAGEEIKAKEAIATLPKEPVNFRPPAAVDVTGNISAVLSVYEVTTAGVISSVLTNATAGSAIIFDGCTYNLT